MAVEPDENRKVVIGLILLFATFYVGYILGAATHMTGY